MIPVAFTDQGINYDQHAFYQWDWGQKLSITGLTIPNTSEVHFARNGAIADVAIPVFGNDGTITVSIPNSIFLLEGEFNAYIYLPDTGEGKTLHSITFYVKGREKPENYNPPAETFTLSAQFSESNTPSPDLADRVAALEDAVNKLTLMGLGEM